MSVIMYPLARDYDEFEFNFLYPTNTFVQISCYMYSVCVLWLLVDTIIKYIETLFCSLITKVTCFAQVHVHVVWNL